MALDGPDPARVYQEPGRGRFRVETMGSESAKLPRKLDALQELFDEVGTGRLSRRALRDLIDLIGFADLETALADVADAAVDDYFTSKASEWTIEPKFRAMAQEWAKHVAREIDRWAR